MRVAHAHVLERTLSCSWCGQEREDSSQSTRWKRAALFMLACGEYVVYKDRPCQSMRYDICTKGTASAGIADEQPRW